MANGSLTTNSRLGHPHRSLQPQPRRLRLLTWGGPTYRGEPPTPAPAPVSGPSPTIHLVNTDPFARARIAAVQSRVAAPVVSDPRPPPPVPAFSPFRDGHYWCSKCPRKGFTTIPGLMRHVTHQHAGSTVDEATCSLFTAIERVTCTAPACGGPRRVGARVCNRCGQASQARPPGWATSLWAPSARLSAVRTRPPLGLALAPVPPAPLPKRAPRRSSSTATGLRGSVALAESGLVTGLATKCCPPVPSSPAAPFPRLSRSPRCFSRLAATCRRLRAFCTLSPGL